jgi:two-component system sensor histidine kinase/response regulator
MSGQIGVKSESPGGSTFWFTAKFRKQAVAAESSLNAPGRLEGARILVVDPSPSSARIVCDHAAAWAMRYQTVASAPGAIAALKSALAEGDPYVVALIDLQSPEIDGLALGRVIKADPQFARIRLLGMHPLGGRPDEAQARAAGIKSLLAKPIRQSQLFNSLNVLLAGARATVPAPVQGRGPVTREIASRVPPEMRAHLKLLLVEDDEVNQQVAFRMIQRLGFHASVVANGRQALEELTQTSYDLILMDWQMPEMDGLSATRKFAGVKDRPVTRR